ncbi:MAG: mycothione reductase [Nesterenkonia sp.]|nr:mycothione reductase [Nesterenkonia sp.]
MAILRPDLAIIGSGSGNTLVTPFWDDQQVVLAEKGVGSEGAFGGTCLNVGCIPTKMFVRAAEAARAPEEAARLNVSQRTEAVDWPGLRDRIFSRIDPISAAGRRHRDEHLDHVTLIREQVRLTGPRSFAAADGTRVEADRLVLAAGSRAELPDVPGIELPQVHTSDSIMRLGELPRRILIVGGGYVACEFAGIFDGLGSEVVQINRSQGLMKSVDAEVADRYTDLAQQRWDVRLRRTLLDVHRSEDQLQGAVTALIDGPEGRETVEADIVLIALGRRPNTDLIGADEVGLDLHADGRLVVDAHQQVLRDGAPVPGLFALGDICSAVQLKHVANHEARVVAHNLEHPDRLRAARHRAIPSAVFTHPELAQVGLTEAEAVAERGAEHVTTKTQEFGDTAYGWAMEDTTGIFKVIADRRDGEILGAHVMGYQASNLIQPVVQAMSFGQDAHTAARGQYWIHPALSEVVENALLGLDVPVGEDAPL